jgi:hypothetical protein
MATRPSGNRAVPSGRPARRLLLLGCSCWRTWASFPIGSTLGAKKICKNESGIDTIFTFQDRPPLCCSPSAETHQPFSLVDEQPKWPMWNKDRCHRCAATRGSAREENKAIGFLRALRKSCQYRGLSLVCRWEIREHRSRTHSECTDFSRSPVYAGPESRRATVGRSHSLLREMRYFPTWRLVQARPSSVASCQIE